MRVPTGHAARAAWTIAAAASSRLSKLATLVPRRLADALLVQAGLAADRRAAALSRQDRALLAACVKRLRLPVAGTLGFGKAEVTAGGVSLDEVHSRDMQSKRVPGLFIAGELLDLDGPSPVIKDKKGTARVGASATTTISRKDFGMTFNKALDSGGVLVGDEIAISLDIEAIE